MSGDRIRVFIVDDHPIVHDGLDRGLGSNPQFEIIGHADNAEAAIVAIKEVCPDVILLDLSLPGMSGLEAIPLLKQATPNSSIIIFSMLDKESLIQRAIRLGAMGYVLKGSGIEEIAEAVLTVHKGDPFLSPEIKSKVVENFLSFCQTSAPVNKYDLLTEREQQIFRLMVEGYSINKIAKKVFLSPKTVEKHRSSIIKKLGIQETVAMVKFAIEIGVIDPHTWPR